MLVHNCPVGDDLAEAVEEGVGASKAGDGGWTIYLRADKATGGEYVGQAKPGRFEARQAEHAKKNPNADYDFDVLEEVEPGSGRSLDVAEEDWI